MFVNVRRWKLGLAAALVLGLALWIAGPRVWAAATAQDSLYYRLVGLVNTSGTQTSPATEDTLAALSAAVGGGEDVQTTICTLADGVTTAVSTGTAGSQIVVVAMDLSLVGAATVTFSDATTAFGATSTAASNAMTCPATGGRVWPGFMPGYIEAADGHTLGIFCTGSTGSALVRWAKR